MSIATTINKLIANVNANITTNGNEEITGLVHRNVLIFILNGLKKLFEELNADIVNLFAAWDEETEYIGNVEEIVRYDGELWVFVSATNKTGVVPGTNGSVWAPLDALTLAHPRNRDAMLARGTINQVTAAEIRAFIDTFTEPGAALWGAIGGDIEGQTDLVAYIAAQIADFITESTVTNTSRNYSKGQGLTPVALSISSGQTAIPSADSNHYTLSVSANTQIQLPTPARNYSFLIECTVTGAGGWAVTFQSGYIFNQNTPPTLPNVTGDKYTLYCQGFASGKVHVTLFEEQ
jgi:hypothetical protein